MNFKFLLFILSLFSALNSFAQENNSVEMADTFRSEGKIYVVIVIALIILIGIFAYLYVLDKKVNKIQEQLKK